MFRDLTALYITIIYWAQAQFPYIGEWLNTVTIYYEEMYSCKKKKKRRSSLNSQGVISGLRKQRENILMQEIRGNNKMYMHLFICANRNIGAINKTNEMKVIRQGVHKVLQIFA